jgi:DNA helicase-2/ATP-dependent DNA helicase PcrA
MNYQTKIEENNIQILDYRRLIIELENANTEYEKILVELEDNKDIIELNDQQLQAVNGSDTNSIIIACPGSGKTHTLIAKVVNLIKNKKVDPSRIIMITFTKKASQEMNERLSNKIGYSKLLHIGTIHGLAYRTLQKYDKINYTILDEKDTMKGILSIFEKISDNSELETDIRSFVYKKIVIAYNILSSKYPITIDQIIEDLKIKKHAKLVKDTMSLYNKFKIDNKYLDFNDLMIKFLSFLQNSNADQFKDNYDYIMFDEYQDVNSIQNHILKEMNKKCQNLTVVGDDAQAIYSFRGSEVKYIINFDKLYNNVNKYFLEKNYRSTPEIINFCNDVIKNNNNQLVKNMVPTKSKSIIKPKIIGFPDMNSEVQYIVGSIKYNLEIGMKLKDNVIITRKNRQLDNFELQLIKNKINYIKSKGIGLLDRVHIKDFLAFLIILVNNDSTIHWKRVLGMVDKIGNVTINKICMNKNLFSVIKTPGKMSIDNATVKKLYGLSKLIHGLEELYSDNTIGLICDRIIEFIKPIIEKNMKVKEVTSFEEKIDDLGTLKTHVIASSSLQQFLADIHLNISVDKSNMFEDMNDPDDYLLLSTIHGSKGLEWDNVYLAGCSSDIMPSFKPNLYCNELDDVEEERRLFYVGCSRAKKTLNVTLSYDYHYTGNQIYTTPFIGEIDNFLYNGVNLIYPNRIYQGDVTKIINNYLIIKSVSKIYKYLKELDYTYESYYLPYVDQSIYKNKCEMIFGTFIDNLIAKMVYQNFNVVEFTVPVYERNNLRKDKPYHDYVDPNNDWKDCIDSIIRVSCKKSHLRIGQDELIKMLSTEEHMTHYHRIEKIINKIIKEESADNTLPINLHHNLSFGEVMGEADIVVGKTLIEIKASKECIATTKYVLQTIMYRYLLRKKGIRIDKIILLNPILGESYILHIVPGWKHTFRVYDEIMNYDQTLNIQTNRHMLKTLSRIDQELKPNHASLSQKLYDHHQFLVTDA